MASTGNTSPFFRRPSNSITDRRAAASAGARHRGSRTGAPPSSPLPAQSSVERLADHLSRVVAEDCRRAGIPDRDQMILIGTYQAIAKRHRDTLKAVLRDAAEQSPEIDFVESQWRRGRPRSQHATTMYRERAATSPAAGSRAFQPRPPCRARSDHAPCRPRERRQHNIIDQRNDGTERRPASTGSEVACSARFCRKSIPPRAPAATGRKQCRRSEC